MAYNDRYTIITGVEFPNKDFNFTEEYFELQRLNNSLMKDPNFDLQMEIMRGNRDAIRLWELFTKANNIKFTEIPNMQALRDEIKQLRELIDNKRVNNEKVQPNISLRVPKQLKRLNDWKAAWRKVKGKWKGGSSYYELAKLANLSADTIADIVKAGDAGLLD